eukprot:TRINITY_DN3753_c0_g1_i4.p1 TRINITY_DN3753_c0_g1~~TRINITY_DN3753_c0_g1_i4.p1  ORF type:complete len:767 (+),score=191.47 TRINITY_DN3753_c0_g1_i4:72-2303(+)
MWMLGLRPASSAQERLATEQEDDAADLLRRLRTDRSAVTAALVELPGIADAKSARHQTERLLQRVDGMQLTRRDIAWTQALQLCIKEREESESHELVRLMAEKKQWDFLAKRFEKLLVEAVLEELGVEALEELFASVKQCTGARQATADQGNVAHGDEGDSEAMPVKRRRLTSSPRSTTSQLVILPAIAAGQGEEANAGHISKVGEVLASKLAHVKETDPSVSLRLRDVFVELHLLLRDGRHMTKLAALVREDHQHLCLEGWSQRVDRLVLQSLLSDCSAATDTVLEDFRLTLAAMLAVLGERLEAEGDLPGAAGAFRRVLEVQPGHPSVRASLLDVLLAQYASDDAGQEDISRSELLELLAAESRWEKLVLLYDSLKAALGDALPRWDEVRLQHLAEALQATGRTVEAAAVHVCLASCHEQAGRTELAYAHYRKAFALNGADAEAEAGMCRLALPAGCVQDAASELLERQARGEQPERAGARIREAVQLLSAHAENLAKDARRDAEASFAKHLVELQKAERASGWAETITSAKKEGGSIGLFNFPCLGRGRTPQAFRSPSPLPQPTPMPLALPPAPQCPAADPEVQPKKASGKGHQLRMKYPGRVPVICRPAAVPGKPVAKEVCAKMQFLVPDTMPCGELKKLMHRKVALSAAGKGAALGAAGLVNHSKPVDSDSSFAKLYETSSQDDGCLHFTYSVERTLGGGLGLELFAAASLGSALSEAGADVSTWDSETRTGVVRSRA